MQLLTTVNVIDNSLKTLKKLSTNTTCSHTRRIGVVFASAYVIEARIWYQTKPVLVMQLCVTDEPKIGIRCLELQFLGRIRHGP